MTSLFVKTQTRLTELADRRRGATMLEYVMIAGVMLGIVTLLSTVLRPAVGNLINRITDFVTGSDTV